jgi:divalent metal cation (Fe/Co/Zn/Cd) transporter
MKIITHRFTTNIRPEIKFSGIYMAGISLAYSVNIIEITTILLLIVNLALLFVSMRLLGGLIQGLIQNLSQEIADAIEEIVKQAQMIDMPEVNPIQLMVMEMIKNKIEQNDQNLDNKKEIKEVLRNPDGTFTKDTSL